MTSDLHSNYVNSMSEDSSAFMVERIIDKKRIGLHKFYLVKWTGYPDSQNTWEPVGNLSNVRDMIRAFD